jgi:serine/threonine protein kinase
VLVEKGGHMQEFSMGWGVSAKVYVPEEDKTVAIKEFYPNREAIFENERAILSTIAHPRIIKCYKASFEKGVCRLFLELAERDLLYRFFCTDAPPSTLSLRMRYAMEVAEALTYLHGEGVNVLHLDLNLGNILLVEKGEHIKLTDFGCSRQLKPGQEDYISAQKLGHPDYDPPEIHSDSREYTYSRKTDAYSFGVVLHALRFLKRPHRETPFGIPKKFPQENRDFLFPFWDKDPKKRPDIKVATDELQMKKFFTIEH